MMPIELRNKISTKKLVKVAGAFDPLSAKLVEISGFDAVWASSFAISATHLLPDAGIMTMTEFLSVATAMREVCKIPIIADCDTGYGGPNNVRHMIKKYESAGIAGISIEDQVFPKKNSLLNANQEILPEKEFVAKILAAKESRQNKDVMIIARTEALIVGLGLTEAHKRAIAYERAGADAILIHSKSTNPNEVLEFCDNWNGNIPIVIVPTTYPQITEEEMIKHHIKMVIFANQTLRTAYSAMKSVLKQLMRSASPSQINERMATMEEIFTIQEMYKIRNDEKSIAENLRKMGYLD